MSVIIQSIDFKASASLERFIREKVGKLLRQSEKVDTIAVVLREEEYHNIKQQSCEIRLGMPGNDPVVKKYADLFEKSIVLSVKALQKILRRKKNRVIASNRQGTGLA